MWRRRIRGDYGKRSRAKFWRGLALVVFFGIIGWFLVSTLLFAWYAKDLPRPDKIVRREGFATRIYDRNGELLYDIFGDQRRIPVELKDVPEYLKQATIAIEDKDFYKHQGFDPRGILRAVFNIIFRGRLQGGSTLTQQLVKNVLLTSERRLGRKIKEFILSVQIEKKFSKDEILQMYLNEAPYGGTAWGIGTASEVYFKKKVQNLTLVEAAILSGMPQSPSIYSPYGSNPKAYLDRTRDVLRRMREDKYITREQENQALEELKKVEFVPQSTGIVAPHFVFYVRDILNEMFGEKLVEQGGLQITTTLDSRLQDKAQGIVSEEISKVENLHITNGASLVMDGVRGEILAMVGSKNFFDKDYEGQVNVVLSKRQPGSAIKPVTYATAFRKGFTPASMLMDVETEFPGADNKPYKPVNYDGKYHGPLQLRYGLGSSINVPAVKLLALVGVKDMLTLARDMGFTTLSPTGDEVRRLGLSVTLGGGEVRLLDMVSAYGAFGNGGTKIEPVAILKVTDKSGKVLFEHHDVKGKQVLSPGEAFLINSILSDNTARLITFGENSLINIKGRSIAVKTGTTNDRRDNWTVGWTRDSVVGVWVGNNDNSQMKEVTSGVSGAAPIWRRIMMEVLRTRPDSVFAMPEEVEARLVDNVSGYPEHDGFSSRSEYFIKGTVPTEKDPIHVNLDICKADGKLATDLDIAKGDTEKKEYFIFKEKEILFNDGRNHWQEGIDNWLATMEDGRYHPPTEKCSGNSDLVVTINEPGNQTTTTSNDVTVKMSVAANDAVEWVKIYVDGQEKEKLTSSPYKTTLTLGSGVHTFKARARAKNGQERDSSEVKIGVNVPWNSEASPLPSSSPASTP